MFHGYIVTIAILLAKAETTQKSLENDVIITDISLAVNDPLSDRWLKYTALAESRRSLWAIISLAFLTNLMSPQSLS